MPCIRREIGSQGTNDRPAGPRPPTSLFTTRLIHAGGKVLKVHPGIAEENVRWRVANEPGGGCVGQRMFAQDWLISPEFGSQRPIEAQQGPGRESALPKGLRVFEAGVVEFLAPNRRAKRVQCAPVETVTRCRQMGAGRQRTGHRYWVPATPDQVNRSASRHPPRTTQRLFAWRPADFQQKDATLNTPPAPKPAPAQPAGEVRAITGWRQLLLWPLGMLVRLWGMSLRFEASPEDLRNWMKKDEPVAIVLWHNRLFLAAEIVRRYRKGRQPYALVSASQDGAWLTAFFAAAGLRTVRGSSSRMGREAANALVEVLRAGHDVGITPDGPRGPCYELKPGAVIVTRRTRTPILVVGGEFDSAWRLRSWDRFYIPKPFSRVRMRCDQISAEQLADREAGMALLHARLIAINPDRE
jgi:lysophospholipid acyltransferase (LPLAT)-like uncharacterized protein